MKKNFSFTKKLGKAQEAKATEINDGKLSYVVALEITHVDNDVKRTRVKKSETWFREQSALDSRRKAFALADQFSKDSYIDGKLCEGHLDSPIEGRLKNYRDINMLKINIHCIDKEGDQLTISEKEFNAPNRDELIDLDCEYDLYLQYGYDTGGDPHIVEDDEEYQYKVINFGNNEASDTYYYVGLDETIDEIRSNGIRAEEDGYIVLLTRKEIADNYVLNQLLHAGKYPLIEVSARGITGVIKPYITGEYAAFHQRLVQQDKIEPQYIKSFQDCDSRELKLYFDYNAKEREIFPDMILSLDAWKEELMKIESKTRSLDQSVA